MVTGMSQQLPRRASKRNDCRLWKPDLFHQHNRKGEDSHDRDKEAQGTSLGSFFAPETDMIFFRGRLDCNSVQLMLSFVVCQRQHVRSVFHISG